jgi:hypothetical protein
VLLEERSSERGDAGQGVQPIAVGYPGCPFTSGIQAKHGGVHVEDSPQAGGSEVCGSDVQGGFRWVKTMEDCGLRIYQGRARPKHGNEGLGKAQNLPTGVLHCEGLGGSTGGTGPVGGTNDGSAMPTGDVLLSSSGLRLCEVEKGPSEEAGGPMLVRKSLIPLSTEERSYLYHAFDYFHDFKKHETTAQYFGRLDRERNLLAIGKLQDKKNKFN